MGQVHHVKETARRFDFDVAVLGGGSAGYAAARTAAAAGLKTVVLEGGREVGGLCILRGCMPSKALLHAAEVLHSIQHAKRLGIHAGKVRVDFQKVMRWKRGLIKEFADYRAQQLGDGRFKFIRACGRFIDPHTLVLDNGRKLSSKHFVIATGSMVSPPPLSQLSETGYITSDDVLSLKRLPKSLIVLGGGAIAAELAQFLVRFGVKVTMVQRSPHILKDFDVDAAKVVEGALRRDGIKLFTDTKLLDARRERGGKVVEFQQGRKRVRVKAEEILLALGRTPNTSGLGLEHAGVKTDGGRIVSDSAMRTSAPHIFAAGDCTGPYEIVHIAVQQGEVAAHNLAHPRKPRRMDHRLLTNVVFTEPQLATVGLTEKEAAARKIPVLTASYPFNDHGKSLILGATDGFVKLLAHPRTGEILGGCCVGPVGGELIHEITAAMAKRMDVHELEVMPHYHPTLAEIWTYPAEEIAEQVRRSWGDTASDWRQ